MFFLGVLVVGWGSGLEDTVTIVALHSGCAQGCRKARELDI